MAYAPNPNQPYNHGNLRTPGTGPTMYYPIMQPQPPGAIINGATAAAAGTGGMVTNVAGTATMVGVPSTTIPNVVVPPPRPKKVLTITVRCNQLFSLIFNWTM
jgi:hypothetical protein